jgi:hypothetical protein
MKPHNPTNGHDGDYGRQGARRYNRHARDFMENEGRVEEAARDAKSWVDREPDAAEAAEMRGKQGPHPVRVSVEELVAKSRSLVDRIKPVVQRAADRIRDRLNRK